MELQLKREVTRQILSHILTQPIKFSIALNFDFIVNVYAPYTIRLARIQRKGHITQDIFGKIASCQYLPQKTLKSSDFTMYNISRLCTIKSLTNLFVYGSKRNCFRY